MDQLFYILTIVFGFGFLIFIHELGHFLVAKYYKVRCPYFSIGFGVAGQMPPILAYRRGVGLRFFKGTDKEYLDRASEHLRTQGIDPEQATRQQVYDAGDALGLSETEYRWMLLPLGGYVAMEGQEDLDPTARSTDPRAFNNQTARARIAILSAGVVMNVVFGFLFFIAAFAIGVDFPAPRVGDVLPDSPAATAYADGHDDDPAYLGLQPGDRVRSINGNTTNDFQEVMMSVALGPKDTPLDVVVERPGLDEPLTYTVTPVRDEAVEGLLSIGLFPSRSLTVASILEQSPDGSTPPAYAAGVRPDMTITAVNGDPVADYAAFTRRLTANRDGRATLTFTAPDGNTVQYAASPEPRLAPGDADTRASLLGLVPPLAIDTLVPGSVAAQAGVQPGDVLVTVGDTDWPTTFQQATAAIGAADAVGLRVWRNGEVLDLGQVEPDNGKLGVVLAPAYTTALLVPLDDTLPEPLAALDLSSGSTLVSVNGEPVQDWAGFQAALQRAAGDGASSVTLTALPNVANAAPATATVPLTGGDRATLAAARWAMPLDINFGEDSFTVTATGPINAIGIGLGRVKTAGQQVYVTLLRLIQGTVGVKNLRGPVGIIDAGAQVARKGLPWYLYFLGLISINLAVLNFLPLPIVDGGHVLMTLVEKARGKPASARLQQVIFGAGLAVMGTLFLFVTYHDIARLITGG